MGFFSAFEGRKTLINFHLSSKYISIKTYNRRNGSNRSHRQHELLKEHHLPMAKVSPSSPTGHHWKPCSHHYDKEERHGFSRQVYWCRSCYRRSRRIRCWYWFCLRIPHHWIRSQSIIETTVVLIYYFRIRLV